MDCVVDGISALLAKYLVSHTEDTAKRSPGLRVARVAAESM
jgi:hypothetical protein